MGQKGSRLALALAASAICGCATTAEDAPRPTTPVDSVRKVIDSLSAEIARRRETAPFRNLPVVVQPAGSGIEPIVAELLRTRLVENGVQVNHSCVPGCMEVLLQEFAVDSPRGPRLTPGQLMTVAGGSIPVVGGLLRSLGEQENEKQRAANRTSGLLVTFSARDGNRYSARTNLVAITSAGDVALEKK